MSRSQLGGNHLRYWQQKGTNAIFMAVSVETNLTNEHDVQRPDGYDAGRDQLLGNATVSSGVSANNYTFVTTSTNVTGLLPTCARSCPSFRIKG